MKNRVISLLGNKLDNRGFDDRRWNRWRPNVGLCAQPDFMVDELTLIYNTRDEGLFKLTCTDIQTLSPNTRVTGIPVEMANAWDFAESYRMLRGVTDSLDKSLDYHIHVTTGTHTQQFALGLMVLTHEIPGKIIQARPHYGEDPDRVNIHGSVDVVDFRLAKYDALSALLNDDKASAEDILKKGINTSSDLYNAVISRIETVAMRSNTPMLLCGPTGSGKTQLAGQITDLKKRQGMVSGKFVSVNCATFNGNQEGAKSALFGHKKGAYTGAANDRKGFLLEADKGVLFLDEVGTLGLEEQGMLLHALENKSFYPLGSDDEAKSDFVLICGTNEDLRQSVKKGTFRGDLLARINMWTFSLPGLADRREDIEPNILFELARLTQNGERTVRFNKEAQELYLKFSQSKEALWLSNFRDLSSSIERMAILCNGPRISVDLVQEEIERLRHDWHDGSEDAPIQGNVLEGLVSKDILDDLPMVERETLRLTVNTCLECNTQAEAAKMLYGNARGDVEMHNPSARLANYLRKFGLDFKAATGHQTKA